MCFTKCLIPRNTRSGSSLLDMSRPNPAELLIVKKPWFHGYCKDYLILRLIRFISTTVCSFRTVSLKVHFMHVILLILLNRSRNYNFSIKSSVYKNGTTIQGRIQDSLWRDGCQNKIMSNFRKNLMKSRKSWFLERKPVPRHSTLIHQSSMDFFSPTTVSPPSPLHQPQNTRGVETAGKRPFESSINTGFCHFHGKLFCFC